jgi:hypothetical protein
MAGPDAAYERLEAGRPFIPLQLAGDGACECAPLAAWSIWGRELACQGLRVDAEVHALYYVCRYRYWAGVHS